MKKKLLSVLLSAVLLTAVISSAFCVSAAGSSIALNTKSLKVGGNLTATVTINAGTAMYATEAYVRYDSSLLKFTSGTSANLQGGYVKIIGTPGGAASQSYTLNFTALAEGTASLYLENVSAVTDNQISLSGASVGGITISNSNTSSKPPVDNTANNANANLSAVTIAGGQFNPAFSPSVTEYTVTVENSTARTSVAATPAYKKAKVTGTGDFELQEGDNPIAIIVTAVDGTKKTYNFNIKRLTIEETMNVNPLATVIDGQMHHIFADLSGTPAPQGFALDTAEYNAQPVGVFKSPDGEYTIFVISNDADASSDYYTYKAERDEFIKLNYITIAGNFCILCELPEEYQVPDGYYRTTVNIENRDIVAFCSNDESMIDFYYIYCYAFGTTGFFRYDMAFNTLQRAPEFSLETSEKSLSVSSSIIEYIKSATLLEKILAVSTLLLLIAVIVLAVLLAGKLHTRKKQKNLDKNGNYVFDDETESLLTPFSEILQDDNSSESSPKH